LSILQGSEEQGSERQHSDAARLGAAPDACKWSLDTQPAELRHFAGNKGKRATADVEQSARRVVIAAELFHDHACAIRQIECGAVDEANADPAAGRGLYDVAGADRVAGFDPKGRTVRTRQGARPHDRFDLPNSQYRSRRRLCVKAGRLIVKHKPTMAGHWPPPPHGLRAGPWQSFLV